MDASERIQAVRKMGRATAKSYIDSVITGFHELHGDRRFADDHAIIGGIGWLSDIPVTVIGIEKVPNSTLLPKSVIRFMTFPEKAAIVAEII